MTDSSISEHAARPSGRPKSRAILGFLTHPVVIFLALLGVLFGLPIAWYGSMNSALEALRGHSLVVDSTSKSIGTVKATETPSVTFRLRNISSRPVRIVGSLKTCGCLASDKVPFTMEPWETRDFRVVVDPSHAEGTFAQRVILHTSVPEQPSMTFNIIGQVDADESGSRKG